ncbi:histidinol-phosphatase HisJ family protein [Paenibacillus cymbidii]|uniref:histidinol-phosphatase HisJ family protein n=1 Tax=Paenibacillus cymbidii TaxID=1639034 RepID=UPI0010819B77|nr:histidinol-phosphatase HisJ family protein [Paenibacillus cymbidii]
MKIDYHTHHDRCGHARGTLRDMIEAALAAGMDQLGLSDHIPLFFQPGDHPAPGMTMAQSEFPRYADEMVRLRAEYAGRLDIRLGVESDYMPGWMERYKGIFAAYPLDYVIGSVHYFEGRHVFDRRRWEEDGADPLQTFTHYIRLVQEAAQCGAFDILGHLDAVKGLGFLPSEPLTALWDETVRIIAERDLVVEVNTSGTRKPARAWFPSTDLLERLHRAGVGFTFGSDAHSPAELLHDWEQVAEFLQGIGVRQLAAFRNRKREMVPLVR